MIKKEWYSKSQISGRGSIDRIWHAPPQQYGNSELPLSLFFTGFSQWKAGHYFTRENCPYFAIEFVTDGNITYRRNGMEFICEKGSLFLQHPGDTVHYKPGPAGYAHKQFMAIRGTMISSFIDQCMLSDISIVKNPDQVAVQQKLCDSTELICTLPVNFNSRISSLCYAVIMDISTAIPAEAFPSHIQAILDYMRRNILTMLNINELSKFSHMSHSQLFREFHKYLNSTPVKYFHRMKMKYAQELLAHSPHRIKQVGFMLGFKDSAFFSNQFRAYSGVSPREYREKMRQKA